MSASTPPADKPAPPPAAPSLSPSPTAAPSVDAPLPATQLTPEEQMALFEKELKETDWGHQPC